MLQTSADVLHTYSTVVLVCVGSMVTVTLVLVLCVCKGGSKTSREGETSVDAAQSKSNSKKKRDVSLKTKATANGSILRGKKHKNTHEVTLDMNHESASVTTGANGGPGGTHNGGAGADALRPLSHDQRALPDIPHNNSSIPADEPSNISDVPEAHYDIIPKPTVASSASHMDDPTQNVYEPVADVSIHAASTSSAVPLRTSVMDVGGSNAGRLQMQDNMDGVYSLVNDPADDTNASPAGGGSDRGAAGVVRPKPSGSGSSGNRPVSHPYEAVRSPPVYAQIERKRNTIAVGAATGRHAGERLSKEWSAMLASSETLTDSYASVATPPVPVKNFSPQPPPPPPLPPPGGAASMHTGGGASSSGSASSSNDHTSPGVGVGTAGGAAGPLHTTLPPIPPSNPHGPPTTVAGGTTGSSVTTAPPPGGVVTQGVTIVNVPGTTAAVHGGNSEPPYSSVTARESLANIRVREAQEGLRYNRHTIAGYSTPTNLAPVTDTPTNSNAAAAASHNRTYETVAGYDTIAPSPVGRLGNSALTRNQSNSQDTQSLGSDLYAEITSGNNSTRSSMYARVGDVPSLHASTPPPPPPPTGAHPTGAVASARHASPTARTSAAMQPCDDDIPEPGYSVIRQSVIDYNSPTTSHNRGSLPAAATSGATQTKSTNRNASQPQPQAVYSVVNKPKRLSGTTTVSGAEDPVLPVYAQVKKPPRGVTTATKDSVAQAADCNQVDSVSNKHQGGARPKVCDVPQQGGASISSEQVVLDDYSTINDVETALECDGGYHTLDDVDEINGIVGATGPVTGGLDNVDPDYDIVDDLGFDSVNAGGHGAASSASRPGSSSNVQNVVAPRRAAPSGDLVGVKAGRWVTREPIYQDIQEVDEEMPKGNGDDDDDGDYGELL